MNRHKKLNNTPPVKTDSDLVCVCVSTCVSGCCHSKHLLSNDRCNIKRLTVRHVLILTLIHISTYRSQRNCEAPHLSEVIKMEDAKNISTKVTVVRSMTHKQTHVEGNKRIQIYKRG